METTSASARAGDDAAFVAIDHHRHSARSRVKFSGELDLAVRARFEDVLSELASTDGPVDLDWSEVTFSSAEGLRMLVELRRGATGPRVMSSRSGPVMDRLAAFFSLGSFLVSPAARAVSAPPA